MSAGKALERPTTSTPLRSDTQNWLGAPLQDFVYSGFAYFGKDHANSILYDFVPFLALQRTHEHPEKLQTRYLIFHA